MILITCDKCECHLNKQNMVEVGYVSVETHNKTTPTFCLDCFKSFLSDLTKAKHFREMFNMYEYNRIERHLNDNEDKR